MLLLHLCDPAQHGAILTAMACAALVTLLTGSYSADVRSSEEIRLILTVLAGLHSDVLIAAMRHDGVAAAVAEQRRDAITVLAEVAYQDPSDGELQKDIDRNNAEVFDAFAAGAVQVSPWICCH